MAGLILLLCVIFVVASVTVKKMVKIGVYFESYRKIKRGTIRYDTIEEINVDSKAEYTA